ARARVLYDKGTDRQAFFLGLVDKYSWRDTGSSFGLSDILAAALVGQLDVAEEIQAQRRRVFERYLDLLSGAAIEHGFTVPTIPDDCVPAYHLFHVLLPDHATRTRVMAAMKTEGIATTFHYVPLHSSDGGRRFAAREVPCPVTDDISGRLVRLPFYNDLSDAEIDRVVSSFLGALS
ncbi:MAG: DegT/DnrJ/EryC1/StrS family aminotransferase, partial [Nocardioides sp.]